MSLIEQFARSPRDFPEGDLCALADEVRGRIIEVVSRNGGHLASSLGAVEICIALLRAFDPLRDRIVFDVGHQAYAWKILTGRNGDFDTLRQFGGVSGFPRIAESPADAFGAGHAGVAISAALGMAAARAGEPAPRSVVAVTGDASISNGISLEALNNAATAAGPFIVLLNDNEMSISRNVGALSRHFGYLLSSRRYNRVKTGIESFGKRLRLHGLSGFYHRVESGIKRLFVHSGFFENLGLRYMGPLDGHNIVRLTHALEIARDYRRPIVIHVATQKGRGYAPAEADPSSWHGVGPFSLDNAKSPISNPQSKISNPEFQISNPQSKISNPEFLISNFKSQISNLESPTTHYALRTPHSFSSAFGEVVSAAARADSRVFAITAAMPSGTGLSSFAREFPGRFFDVGISEEHAVSFAAGLAAGGARPFVALYSSFAQRAVDSFIHDVCLQNLPVTLCLDCAGAVGAGCATHHGLYDIPLFRSLPNAVLAQPRDAATMRGLVALSLAGNAPFVMRYPRGKCGDGAQHGKAPELGRAQVLREPGQGNAAIPARTIWLWALGDMIPIALEVADILEKEGVAGAGVVDPVFIKPLDVGLLHSQLGQGAEIATLENGTLQGGFGSAVMEAASAAGHGTRAIRRFGWPDAIVPHGSTEELLASAGLTAPAIAASLVAIGEV